MDSKQPAKTISTARTSILTVVISGVIVVGALYLWVSPLNSEVDVGLQHLHDPPLIFTIRPVPLDWRWFKRETWTIAYPAQFQIHEIPHTIPGQRSFLFTSEDKRIVVDVTVRLLDTLPEKRLVLKLQKIASYKQYQADILDAILLMQQIANNSKPENERPIIEVERKVVLGEMPGVQFATRDPQGAITFRTSVESDGEVIDITTYPKSFDEIDPSMNTYLQMLSSFH